MLGLEYKHALKLKLQIKSNNQEVVNIEAKAHQLELHLTNVVYQFQVDKR